MNAALRARVSLPEAVGLSLSVICPSVTAAFNVTLVAQATGAAAPLAFAIGRGGLSPTLGRIDARHGTPAPALAVSAVFIIAVFVAWAPFAGPANYCSYVSTIATLCLIAVYIGVGGAEVAEAVREGRRGWAAACVPGPLLMLWVLYRNLYPVPDFPNDLWPYVAAAWLMASWGLTRVRPAAV